MKTITILIMMLMMFSMIQIVVAEEVNLSRAGIGPDSIFYKIERFIESIKIATRFRSHSKAKLKLRYAEERLSEASKMADKGNLEALEIAQKEHDKLVEGAEDLIEGFENEDFFEMQQQVELHRKKVDIVQNSILEKKRSSGEFNEEQLAYLEELFGRIVIKTQDIEQKVVQKQEQVNETIEISEPEEVESRSSGGGGSGSSTTVPVEEEEDKEEVLIEYLEEGEEVVECVVDEDCEIGNICENFECQIEGSEDEFN